MIIVNLKGGLGNQMFQYACGRALSLRNKARGEDAELLLDATGYERSPGKDTPRSYELGGWNIQARLATPKEILPLKYPFGLIISKVFHLFETKMLRRFYVGFVPSILSLHDGAYLDGFWQSEKYFKDFEKDIREDFTLKDGFGRAATTWYEKIAHDPYSVSLHIRRGDYVSDTATSKHWGTCDMEYYARALGAIAQKVPKPNVYVFSDDIAWARENLASDFPLFFVSSPEIGTHEEIALIAAGKHTIIANSSFGWWGAWLNQNPAKLVIAPARWTKVHNETWYADIIPESWTRL